MVCQTKFAAECYFFLKDQRSQVGSKGTVNSCPPAVIDRLKTE
jgi:hypothetical protein